MEKKKNDETWDSSALSALTRTSAPPPEPDGEALLDLRALTSSMPSPPPEDEGRLSLAPEAIAAVAARISQLPDNNFMSPIGSQANSNVMPTPVQAETAPVVAAATLANVAVAPTPNHRDDTPVAAAAEPSGYGKTIGAFGLGVVLMAGGYWILDSKEEAVPSVAMAPTSTSAAPVVVEPSPAAPVALEPTIAQPTVAEPAVAEPAAAATVAEPVVAAPVAAASPTVRTASAAPSSSAVRAPREDAPTTPAAAPAPTVAPAPEPEAPAARPAAGSSLTALLDQAIGGSTPATMAAPAPAAAAEEPVSETPNRASVTRALGGLMPRMRTCAGERTGIAISRIRVNNDGTVASASVGGPFAGTAEGSCMEEVIKSARFPRFTRPTFDLTYPFAIRPPE